eukprot:13171-Chlamydomonas_euryale.AAC.4
MESVAMGRGEGTQVESIAMGWVDGPKAESVAMGRGGKGGQHRNEKGRVGGYMRHNAICVCKGGVRKRVHAGLTARVGPPGHDIQKQAVKPGWTLSVEAGGEAGLDVKCGGRRCSRAGLGTARPLSPSPRSFSPLGTSRPLPLPLPPSLHLSHTLYKVAPLRHTRVLETLGVCFKGSNRTGHGTKDLSR